VSAFSFMAMAGSSSMGSQFKNYARLL
jgi:hypothetical protein